MCRNNSKIDFSLSGMIAMFENYSTTRRKTIVEVVWIFMFKLSKEKKENNVNDRSRLQQEVKEHSTFFFYCLLLLSDDFFLERMSIDRENRAYYLLNWKKNRLLTNFCLFSVFDFYFGISFNKNNREIWRILRKNCLRRCSISKYFFIFETQKFVHGIVI